MSTDAPDLISLGLLRGEVFHERHSRAGRPAQTRLPPPPTLQVRRVRCGRYRVFVGFKRLIRPFVRALYLFPLLLAAKFVLWLMEHPAGDYLTVGFIALLLIFFSLLAVLALLYPMVGPASQRKTSPALALDELDLARAEALLGVTGLQPTTAEQLEGLLRNPGAVGKAIHVRGKVRSATRDELDEPLLLDGWVEGDEVVARLFCGSALLLEAGEGAPPVVLDLQAPPLLVGRYAGNASSLPLPADQRAELASWLNDRSHGAVELARLLDAGSWLQLEAGQEIELVTTGGEVIADLAAATVAGRRLLLDQPEVGGAPYRRDDARRGLLVTCTPEASVLLRIL